MFLVVGLGNPGREYENTRHNVGFMFVDLLAEQAGQSFRRVDRRSLTSRIRRCDQDILLAKPLTFMNSSGEAVRELLEHHSPDISRLLVVYDDIALPFGTFRIRKSGSSGGQKGMKSIVSCLGTQDFPRLRLGISGDSPVGDLSDYVLSNFRKSERAVLRETLDRAIEAFDTVMADGFDRAMALFN